MTEILKEVIKTTSGLYSQFVIEWDDGAKSLVVPKDNKVELTNASGDHTVLELNISQHGYDCVDLINRNGFTI